MNMYYKGNTIVLKGKIKKSASWEKVYDAAEKNYAIAVQMVKGISVGDVFSIWYFFWYVYKKMNPFWGISFMYIILDFVPGNNLEIW